MLALLRTPRWFVGSIVALSLVVIFVNLGLWQLRRLDERRVFNAELESVLELPGVAASDLVTGSAPVVEYQRVSVRGRYEAGMAGIVVLQTRQGVSGVHALAAIRGSDGSLIAVDRGWLALGVAVPEPDEGEVTLQGRARLSRDGGRLTDQGPPPRVDRVDLTILGEAWSTELASFYLEVTLGEDPELAPPVPLVLSEGSHFGYAMQWFAFAAIGAIGFPLLLRREAAQVR